MPSREDSGDKGGGRKMLAGVVCVTVEVRGERDRKERGV